MHKSAGDNVELIPAGKKPKLKPDIIYFSLIFLFNHKKDLGWILTYRKQYPDAIIKIGGISPTLLEDVFKKTLANKDVEIFTGRDLKLEKLSPDFDITGVNYSYGFTTRGCPNSCAWCVVPKVEGRHKIAEGWQSQIDTSKPLFFGFDNNVLACGSKHFREVLEFCQSRKIRVEFNQAMDAEILYKNKKIQQVFLDYPKIWHKLRFAWDSDRAEKGVMFMMDFIHEAGISSNQRFLYMLYDTDDSPEQVFERIKKVRAHPARFKIKLMRFKDLDTGQLLRKWGGIGDLFADGFKITITGHIDYSAYWNYVLSEDLDFFIKNASLAGEYSKQKHARGGKLKSHEFVAFAKRINESPK
jgi:hypothetical protein